MLRDGKYYRNALNEVRESSQFDNFKPRHNSQQRPLAALRALADQVVESAAHIEENEKPFGVGNIILLRGIPGLGKTHLAEAFLNSILKRCPKLAERMAVCKGRHFFTDYCSSERPFGKACIVLIDDIMAGEDMNFENHPCNVEWFGKFILDVYENRQLVILTSNVPVFTKGGIMDHMHVRDREGRVKSRIAELVINQYELQGEDYRAKIGRGRKAGTSLRIGPPNKPIVPPPPKTPAPTGEPLHVLTSPGLSKKVLTRQTHLLLAQKLQGMAGLEKLLESMSDGAAGQGDQLIPQKGELTAELDELFLNDESKQ